LVPPFFPLPDLLASARPLPELLSFLDLFVRRTPPFLQVCYRQWIFFFVFLSHSSVPLFFLLGRFTALSVLLFTAKPKTMVFHLSLHCCGGTFSSRLFVFLAVSGPSFFSVAGRSSTPFFLSSPFPSAPFSSSPPCVFSPALRLQIIWARGLSLVGHFTSGPFFNGGPCSCPSRIPCFLPFPHGPRPPSDPRNYPKAPWLGRSPGASLVNLFFVPSPRSLFLKDLIPFLFVAPFSVELVPSLIGLFSLS